MSKERGGNLNQRLKDERLRRGWSQQEVADQLGTTPNTVSRWELGLTRPTPFLRAKLSTLFGKTAHELGLLAEQSVASAQNYSHESASFAAPPSPIWSVPFHRNPFFTGREDVIQCLREALQADKRPAFTQAISGLGGIGKTQLAIEYAYRYRENYQAVLWFQAETRSGLLTSIVALAEAMHLTESQQEHDQKHIVTAMQRWLSKHDRWLLIVDNVEDMHMVSMILPVIHSGHVLLTTRNQVTGTLAHNICLETMSPQDGALFLLRRAKRIGSAAMLEDAAESERACAIEIVQLMGGLPLALDQAAAYVEETACALPDYRDAYLRQQAMLLSLRGSEVGDHPFSVTATFTLALEQVEQTNQMAANLLHSCAFLHPDAIPEEIFTTAASALVTVQPGVASDPLVLDAALRVLLRFSLLHRNPESKTLTVHRLVQIVLREALPGQAQRQWARFTVCAVNSVFPEVTLTTLAQSQRYLPHASICAEHIERWTMCFSEAERLLHQLGSHCFYRGHYRQAEAYISKACDLRMKMLGAEHPDVADCLKDLAVVSSAQGHYDQAIALRQQALTITEKALGSVHPSTAERLQDLATNHHYQGHYTEVGPLFLRSVRILEQVLGSRHPDVARSLNNWARLFGLEGRYAEAETLHYQALSIEEAALGARHPDVATSLFNLACLYSEQGRYAEAEQLHQRALEIEEQTLGPDHPDVADSLNHLALLYARRGKRAQAEAYGLRALEIRQHALGQEHPLVAQSLQTRAKLALYQRKSVQAQSLLQQALALLEKTLGLEHPQLAESLYDWAEFLVRRGRHAQAEPFYQRALSIWEQTVGREHPRTVECAERSADLQLHLGSEGTRVSSKAGSKQVRVATPLLTAPTETTDTSEQKKRGGRDFFTEQCTLHPQATSRAGELWHAYQLWEQEDEEQGIPLSRRAFAQRLHALGCRPDRTKASRLWQGIALKEWPGDAR